MYDFGWDPQLDTGIECLDTGQRRLFTLINRVYQAACLHRRQEVESTLRELIHEIRSHLCFEEGLLEVAKYPGLASHKDAHSQLLARLERYFEIFLNGGEISLALIVNLRMWLTGHIRQDDDYAPYLLRQLTPTAPGKSG